MELTETLRDPAGAALVAAIITAAYIHIKAQLNNEGKLPLSSYMKPAALNAIMVYIIVANGVGQKETISSEPF